MQKLSTRAGMTPSSAAFARRHLASTTGLALVLCIAAGVSMADTVRWDSGAAAGIQTADGDWNTSDVRWNDEATDVRGTFVDNDDVIFGPATAGPTGSPTITINAGNVAVNSMRFEADGYTIAATGGGRVDLGGGATIAVTGTNTATINAGLADSGQSGVVAINNAAGATLILAGDASGSAADDLQIVANSGTLELSNELSADVTVRNTGTVIVQGTGLITGATLVEGGTLIGAGGDMASVGVTGGTYQVTADSSGSVTQTGGQVEVQATGTLDGDLIISDGTTVNNNTISGNVVQSGGEVINNGDVGGGLSISDGLFVNNAAGVVSATTVVNGADAVVRANGGDFAGGITLQNGTVNVTGGSSAEVTQSGGALNIRGTGELDGNVALSGGTMTVEAGGQLAGALTQTGGTTSNAGTVVGGVTVTGGEFRSSGSGDVEGLTAVSGGGVVVTGSGDFTGGVRVGAGGTFRVTGDSAGNVRQLGGQVVIAEGGILDGRLTQETAGVATNRGTIDGNVVKAAGVLTNAAGATLGNASSTLRQSGGTTNNNGNVLADVFLSGGAFNQSGGTVSGDVRVTGGELVASGGRFTGDTQNRGGLIRVTGAVAGDIVTRSGTTRVEDGATLSGAQRVQGGLFVQDGTTTGTVTVTGGTARLEAGSATAGLTVRSAGQVEAAGGRLTSTARVIGTGQMDVTGNLRGNINVDGALSGGATGQHNLTISAGGNLTGTVTVLAGAVINRGDVTGSVIVRDGDFEAGTGSDVSGPSRVTGGTVTLSGGGFAGGLTASGSGVIQVGTGGGLSRNVNATIEDGGLLDIDAGLTFDGTVVVRDNPDLTGTAGRVVVDGTLDGSIDASAGTITQNNVVTGNVGITGTAVMTTAAGSRIDGLTSIGSGGRVDATGGNFAGGAAVNSGGRLNVTGAIQGDLSSTGSGLIDNDATISGAIANGGVLTGTGAFAGLITNTGRIDNRDGNGNLNLGGGVGGSGGAIDLTRDAATDDVATVSGSGISGAQTLRFNVDIASRSADQVLLQGGASMTGDLVFEFYRQGTTAPEDGGQSDINVGRRFEGDILIATAEGGGTLSLPVNTNLGGSTERFVLGVALNDAGTQLVLRNDINPAFGAIVGNVVLTQSLIGSVINRPTSAAFTPLQDAEDPCGGGMWGRVTAGRADATGTVDTGTTIAETGTNASFQGILLGGDFSCSRGVTGGVNFAVGGLLGLNQGSTNQPISAAIFSGGASGGPVTSTNESDFRQTYLGAYGVLTRGPLAFDLQLRREKTDFDIANIPIASGDALFEETSFSSNATTISGAVTYTFPIRDTGFSVTPRAGFSWTRTTTDTITLTNPGDPANPDILEVDDFDNQVGFVGVAVSRSRPLATNDGGTSLFLSATYYNDFASDPTATLSIGGSATDVENLTLTNLGAYGELSAGWSYVRQLTGGIGGSRQLSATVRGDARTGGSLDSWGITGQVRLQF